MSKSRKKISLQITDCCKINGITIEDDKIDRKSGLNVDKKEIARRRWGLLAKALKSPITSQPSSPTDEISVRRFSSFSLLIPEPLEINEPKYNWYKYTTTINEKKYHVDISHLLRPITAADLMGFNNTGNVCVWPSEEALAYYCLSNLEGFKGKSVLELGGGMSSLAGLLLAKYSTPPVVHLTDGNETAVENIKNSLKRNEFSCPVVCSVLQWGVAMLNDKFDMILSADCLFFDDAREHLIESIWQHLNDKGEALVMAPKRGITLEVFIELSEKRGFRCQKSVYYNEVVWNRHLECLQNGDYDDDIHYPILLRLSKSSASFKTINSLI